VIAEGETLGEPDLPQDRPVLIDRDGRSPEIERPRSLDATLFLQPDEHPTGSSGRNAKPDPSPPGPRGDDRLDHPPLHLAPALPEGPRNVAEAVDRGTQCSDGSEHRSR
jgi:hypothetical protein